jgi:lipid A disaccharide synthetase
LPNIHAGRLLVPERVGAISPAQIAVESADWLSRPERLEALRRELRGLRGEGGAVAALVALVRELLPPQVGDS